MSGILNKFITNDSKSIFFIKRMLVYLAFFSISFFVINTNNLSNMTSIFLLFFYNLFMVGQWFLLGKEIDYRLKIYYKVNSSLERILYRIILGHIVFILYFLLLDLFSIFFIKIFFWATWILLGLFYSWPTRGKIIVESFSTELSEFKFLDPFEKIVLGLVGIILVFSYPEFASYDDFFQIRQFIDPELSITYPFWNFIKINYIPFLGNNDLYMLAINCHIYMIYLSFFLLSFYAFLRYFLSRRLSILGILALVSSWSFSKVFIYDLGNMIPSFLSMLLIWSFLWVSNSSTYRSGLFIGLLGYFACMFNISFTIIVILQIVLILLSLKEYTFWYRRQFIKYSLFGMLLSVFAFVTSFSDFNLSFSYAFKDFAWQLYRIIERKAFFILSFFGLIILILKNCNFNIRPMKEIIIDIQKLKFQLIFFALLILFSLFTNIKLMAFFSWHWPIAFLSLIPLEWIFQSIRRYRSKRNMIYLIYVVVCILDSHVEVRIKNFINFLKF